MRKITKEKIEEIKSELAQDGESSKITIFPDSLQISGGTLRQYAGGVIFTSKNGDQCCAFPGVKMTSVAVNGGAYQLLGYIGIDSDWVSNGFTIYDFAHEYGHYLQQEKYGYWEYLYHIMPESLKTVGTPEHKNNPVEVEATQLGEEYLSTHKKYGNDCAF